MIEDIGDLKDAVSKYLLRANTDLVVTTGQIGTYIQLCEAELNRELRVRELEEVLPITMVVDQNYVDLPADFKKVKDFIFTSTPFDIEALQTFSEMVRKWSQQIGRPRSYSISGQKIYLSHLPDSTYATVLEYYKAIPPLTDAEPTNVILTNYPDIYLYGSLRQAYINLKDRANAEIVGTNYAGIIERVKQADMDSRMPSNLKMSTRGRLA